MCIHTATHRNTDTQNKLRSHQVRDPSLRAKNPDVLSKMWFPGERQVCIKAKRVSLLEKMPQGLSLGSRFEHLNKVPVGEHVHSQGWTSWLCLCSVCNHSSSTPAGVCTLPSRLSFTIQFRAIGTQSLSQRKTS